MMYGMCIEKLFVLVLFRLENKENQDFIIGSMLLCTTAQTCRCCSHTRANRGRRGMASQHHLVNTHLSTILFFLSEVRGWGGGGCLMQVTCLPTQAVKSLTHCEHNTKLQRSSARPLFPRIWSCFSVNTVKASPLIILWKSQRLVRWQLPQWS